MKHTIDKKLSVSIVIPAYNEEANIKKLLLSLLAQKRIGFKIKEIVVLSDGSNDTTISQAKTIDSNLIKIIDKRLRRGKIIRQNEVLKLINCDALVLLDADVVPADDMLLKNLVKPILEDKIDLVSCKIEPLTSSTAVEKIINFSSKIKNNLFEKTVELNGVYLCHGRVRAFSRELYEKLIWPKDIKSGEDAYSYFFCITKGFKFFYQKQAKILYRSPNTLGDHIKQSTRFTQSKRLMKNYFNKEEVNKAYQVNKSLLLKIVLHKLNSSPILFCFYLMIYILSTLLSFVKQRNNQLWEISISTKKL